MDEEKYTTYEIHERQLETNMHGQDHWGDWQVKFRYTENDLKAFHSPKISLINRYTQIAQSNQNKQVRLVKVLNIVQKEFNIDLDL